MIGKYVWKCKDYIWTLIKLRSALNSKKYLEEDERSKQAYYEKIQKKFTVWNKIYLPSVNELKTCLRQQNLEVAEKKSIWTKLVIQVFTEMLLNLYSSEIYKIIFMISTNLCARKQQKFEDYLELLGKIENLNNSIREEMVVTEYIQKKISNLLEEVPLDKVMSAEDIEILFEKIKIELHCVKRIPMPVFEIAVKVFPNYLRAEDKLEEFLKIYCLYGLFRPDVQYELLNRFNEVYENVLKSLKSEINTKGKKINESDQDFGLEMVKLVPIISRQDAFTVWRPYGTLSYKFFFE